MRRSSRSLSTVSRLWASTARRSAVYCWSYLSAGSSSAPASLARSRRRCLEYSRRSLPDTSGSVPRPVASCGIASSASSVARISAKWRSVWTDVSRGSRAQRTATGSRSPWTTRVTTMTPAVTKMITSRPGNGAPDTTVSGTASAAASDTAPRNPAIALTTRARAPTRRSRCCGRRSSARIR